MHGLGKELKEMTAADIPGLWANIARVRESGALHAGSLATRIAATYAVSAVEQRIGALMAEGLPTPPPREDVVMATGAAEIVVQLPAMAEVATAEAGATS